MSSRRKKEKKKGKSDATIIFGSHSQGSLLDAVAVIHLRWILNSINEPRAFCIISGETSTHVRLAPSFLFNALFKEGK